MDGSILDLAHVSRQAEAFYNHFRVEIVTGFFIVTGGFIYWYLNRPGGYGWAFNCLRGMYNGPRRLFNWIGIGFVRIRNFILGDPNRIERIEARAVHVRRLPAVRRMPSITEVTI